MPNHYHLLFYQYDPDAITALMRSVATGYAVYFNKRYNGSGGLFQGVYKASRIRTEGYWEHISRYIHLNPLDIGEDYKEYEYSSYRFYMNSAKADWVKPEKGRNTNSTDAYANFVEDWIPHRRELIEIKDIIANSQEID